MAEVVLPPRGLWGACVIVAVGVALLAAVGLYEDQWVKRQPWHNALLAFKLAPPQGETYPVWSRVLSAERPAFAKAPKWIRQYLTDLQREASLDFSEQVLAIDVAPHILAPLLISGRLPEPGKREVLAGDLTTEKQFLLDGEAFSVVGQLNPSASGLVRSYLMLASPELKQDHFSAEQGAQVGWLDPNGLLHIEEFWMDSGKQPTELVPVLQGGQTRTQPVFAWATLAGLIIVAIGGALGFTRFFLSLATPPTPLLGGLMQEISRRKGLFFCMHVLLYGVFFGAMVLGLKQPTLNFHLSAYLSNVFTEGELGYIGAAYASKDIAQATLATFFNNYVVQTLGFTYALSLFPLAIGVFKTAASFGMVGFLMAPVWTGTATGYTLHSITMVLELEAYILASFTVTVWAIRCFLLFSKAPFWQSVKTNIHIFLGGVLASGALLAIAALYEAITLIAIVPYLS